MTTAELVSTERLGSVHSPDLFQRVLDLGSKRGRGTLFFAFTAAVVIHLGFGGAALAAPFEIGDFARQVSEAARARLRSAYEIETEEPPPPPEPEPEPEPETPPPPPPADAPPATETAEPAPTEAPAPAAAEAGQVLTSEPDPNEPLDLTNDGFLSGTGTRFAGGTTAANGTATSAVRNQGAIAQGTPNATGTAPSAAPAVNRSRPAGLLGTTRWDDCPFPPEADAENINQAVVRLVVVVGADGRPKSVTVVSDPGNGFGRVAKRHAMQQMYQPPLDPSGKPIAGPTPPFAVRFQR